jgi:hypothetical protein
MYADPLKDATSSRVAEKGTTEDVEGAERHVLEGHWIDECVLNRKPGRKGMQE